MKYNLFQVTMNGNAGPAVQEVLDSGMIGEGPKVVEFKEALEKRFQCRNLVPLNSGTSAITLALRLAGVEDGEVITTPFTMIATNVAIKAAGGTPVFADLAPNSVNVSMETVMAKITPETKAVILTLVGGIPMDLKPFALLKVPVIIDAAHAIDTTYLGVHVSHWGDFVCFSFQSIKQLTTGDGGALVCKSNKDYERAEKLKWFGMSRVVPEGMTRLEHQMTADVEEWGYKMHMNDISAAIGLTNLQNLNFVTSRQRENAERYLVKLDAKMYPFVPYYCQPSWWAFPIFVNNREKFMEKMKEKGVETTPMWRRNDAYTVFDDGTRSPLTNMTKVQDKIVFIPVGWWIEKEGIDYIIESIKECI